MNKEKKNVSKVTHPVERHTEVVSSTSGNQSILHGFISDYQGKLASACLRHMVYSLDIGCLASNDIYTVFPPSSPQNFRCNQQLPFRRSNFIAS